MIIRDVASEPPTDEDEDPNEGERQVEEPDVETEEFRGRSNVGQSYLLKKRRKK